MVIYFYKTYKYAPKATNFSGLSMGLTILGLICGAPSAIAYFTNENTHKLPFLILGILLLSMAAVSYFWLYRVVVPSYAIKEHPANLKTNMSVAVQYVKDNPNQYDYICSINHAFAAKYEMQEAGGTMNLRKKK